MSIRLLTKIHGKVQGVSFRKHTLNIARELHVSGWVRNLPDGTVQGCFEGNRSNVEALLVWCSAGPERARVQAVENEIQNYTGEFPEFRIL